MLRPAFLSKIFFCVALLISYAFRLILFSSLFSLLISSLTFLFPLRIGPLRFQAGCHKRRLNVALVFLCLFGVVVHFFSFFDECMLLLC